MCLVADLLMLSFVLFRYVERCFNSLIVAHFQKITQVLRHYQNGAFPFHQCHLVRVSVRHPFLLAWYSIAIWLPMVSCHLGG